MTARLTGTVALITGAARGQGRAHAQRLSAEGADVVLVDIAGPLPASVPYDSPTPEDLAETARLVSANGRRAIAAKVDTRDLDALRSAVDDAVSQLGRLDVIVANAGICCPSPWDQITAEAFRDTIDTNVVGTWNTVMAGTHHIIEGDRGGSIILVGSAAGVKMQAFMVHYTASKHAITGMARGLAAELGRHRIRVNSLHPGAVASPMGTGRMRDALQSAADTYPYLQGMHKPLLPEGIAQPEDVADAVAWLASDESKFVTATAVSVDLGVAFC
ncbi:putative short-chain type dehydrogenase/reductase MSMEG_6031/MSMEI_5872 [uncultured Mycobacterium sp.]|uniref:Putative short-chain type dehydrogenase/reductase MSMEG_6031/MSMEI_5872 n=1 Tax=uncultured Mycobacterium sp. TaxID=171292 RepID=A0A1Y5PFE1_9MYCO|nr:putative short-chain type dehydrogenase/reductase MSMEG_6031/MSMEI_5872 [uncultured Mycobacterium sp.]